MGPALGRSDFTLFERTCYNEFSRIAVAWSYRVVVRSAEERSCAQVEAGLNAESPVISG